MPTCPTCGSAMPVKPMKKAANDEGEVINSVVNKSTSAAGRLKSLRSANTRPAALKSSGISRGGRYSRD